MLRWPGDSQRESGLDSVGNLGYYGIMPMRPYTPLFGWLTRCPELAYFLEGLVLPTILGKVQMGALKWVLKGTLCDSCTVCNCAHLWRFAPFCKGNFHHKQGVFAEKGPRFHGERGLAMRGLGGEGIYGGGGRRSGVFF